ncbi:hypothetical protein B0H21DRAFT_712002 [Amylocystis lapponica]|nr:hypothetical protein B0H21DRAFT_712002 [Amylocystis lapponica]
MPLDVHEPRARGVSIGPGTYAAHALWGGRRCEDGEEGIMTQKLEAVSDPPARAECVPAALNTVLRFYFPFRHRDCRSQQMAVLPWGPCMMSLPAPNAARKWLPHLFTGINPDKYFRQKLTPHLCLELMLLLTAELLLCNACILGSGSLPLLAVIYQRRKAFVDLKPVPSVLLVRYIHLPQRLAPRSHAMLPLQVSYLRPSYNGASGSGKLILIVYQSCWALGSGLLQRDAAPAPLRLGWSGRTWEHEESSSLDYLYDFASMRSSGASAASDVECQQYNWLDSEGDAPEAKTRSWINPQKLSAILSGVSRGAQPMTAGTGCSRLGKASSLVRVSEASALHGGCATASFTRSAAGGSRVDALGLNARARVRPSRAMHTMPYRVHLLTHRSTSPPPPAVLACAIRVRDGRSQLENRGVCTARWHHLQAVARTGHKRRAHIRSLAGVCICPAVARQPAIRGYLRIAAPRRTQSARRRQRCFCWATFLCSWCVRARTADVPQDVQRGCRGTDMGTGVCGASGCQRIQGRILAVFAEKKCTFGGEKVGLQMTSSRLGTPTRGQMTIRALR